MLDRARALTCCNCACNSSVRACAAAASALALRSRSPVICNCSRRCEPAEIDDAIGFAKECGYQSDTRYASMKARNDAGRRGNRTIIFSLSKNGIAKEEIENERANRRGEPIRT
jgi:SOS response regulatory protein OraA/RecX